MILKVIVAGEFLFDHLFSRKASFLHGEKVRLMNQAWCIEDTLLLPQPDPIHTANLQMLPCSRIRLQKSIKKKYNN